MEGNIDPGVKNLLSSLKDEVIAAMEVKLDKTLENFNKRLTQNENKIIEINEEVANVRKDLNNITAVVNIDNESVIDNTERIDRLDSNSKLIDVRMKEAEKLIDEMDSGRIEKIEKQLKELKEGIEKRSYVEVTKTPNQNVTANTETLNRQNTEKSPKTSPSPSQDIFKEARGKIGLFPITLEDIKKCTDNDDIDDATLMTNYSHIETRHKAAQEFLSKEMHFQKDEIVIQTIKMASNWSSNIMWIEVGELNVARLINRSINLKNPKIQLITYFPAPLWKRRKDLNDIMKEKRKIQPELRYKISVGKRDIVLETKIVGEYIWQKIPIEEYLPTNKNIQIGSQNINLPVCKKSNKRKYYS